VNESQRQQLQGIHVLLVEDHEASRRVLCRTLESWGALVSATTAADAIHAPLKADVIVCDLRAAEAAGRDFLPRLQRLHDRRTRPVPTVALVPLGTETPATARAAGVQRYLVKPAEAAELCCAVWQLARE
jgi:CheY-like chemotaxis protein